MFDFQNIKIDKEQINRFDFNQFIYIVSGGTVNYKNSFNDFSVSYDRLDWSHKIFEYLLLKDNTSLLYRKISKIENHFNTEIFKKIKKLRWSDKRLNLTFRDYQYHFSEFTLNRIQYVKKETSFTSKEDHKYEQYKREVSSFSSKLYMQIGVNEQLERESMPGSKYYQTDALSVLIKYKSKQIGLLRFKFLHKDTSYIDQGKLVSILYAISYLIFLQEHDEIPKFDINSLLDMNERKVFKEILKQVENIEQIMIFREPKIGRIFEKYKYKFSPNYYYLHTLHARAGIDISRGDLLEKSILVREQALAGNHLYNNQDTFYNNINYFNFVEIMLRKDSICDYYIPDELYCNLMDVVNEIFFEAVIYQQQTIYHMIKNQVRSKYTKKIKKCNLSYIDIAKMNMDKVENDFKKKGPDRIKKEEKNFRINCIQKWISFLESNKRIDPGSNIIIDFLHKNEDCETYILNEFVSSIPWIDWKDYVRFAKELLKERIEKKQYKMYKDNLEQFIESIFSNKSFLFNQEKSGRAVFFKAIKNQLDSWGEYDMRMRRKNKHASFSKILKKSIKGAATKTLQSFAQKA